MSGKDGRGKLREAVEADAARAAEIDREKHDFALRSQIQLLNSKYKALLRESHAQDRIVGYAKLALNALPPAPAYKPPVLREHRERWRESVVLACGCWHIGETIDKTAMDGLNEYDFDIFCARLQFLVDTTIRYTRALSGAYDFEELHIFHLGDFVSGIIHDELSETNCLNIVEQAQLGAFVTAQAIRELAAHFKRIVFTGVVGNHGRNKKQKEAKRKAQINWDFVAYNDIALLLRNQKNVTFNIPLSPWALVGVQDHIFHIQHGDEVKSWAGIPWYGIERDRIKTLEREIKRGRLVKYLVRSHFHTGGELQNSLGDGVLVGSLKGSCEYGTRFGDNDPRQVLFGVSRKRGMSWRLPLDPMSMSGVKSRYVYDRTKAMGVQELP